MKDEFWRPSTTKERLFARAELLKNIRSFFAQRSVLEVETPILSHAAGTDPNLDSIIASNQEDQAKENKLFLQTSPEFAMKRLLADGSGAIFQICKSFRQAELGAKHNPEFTLLEWYQPGYDEHQLMNELMVLVQSFFPQDSLIQQSWAKQSYQSLFDQYLSINPHTISTKELNRLAKKEINIDLEINKDACLDLLFSHIIEPQLQAPTFIYDYPASQAALASFGQNDDGVTIARRFELVISGMEIANGYFELTDVEEQSKRFTDDLEIRQNRKKPINPIDENFLAAMNQGLPSCSGVAVGLDRLLMLIVSAQSIEEVLAFPFHKA